MGVKACDRQDCDNVMCDRYNNLFGYLCNECFGEMKDKKISGCDEIEEFMNSRKNEETYDNLDDVFPLDDDDDDYIR